MKGPLLAGWWCHCPIISAEFQHDRGPTGSLELHGRRGSRKEPKRTLVGETLWPCRRGQGPTRNRLGKGPIESGMILDGSDTIPGHVSVQGNQLRSWRWQGQLSRTARRMMMSIFHRPPGDLHLGRPKERGQEPRSIRLHHMWGDFEEWDSPRPGPCLHFVGFKSQNSSIHFLNPLYTTATWMTPSLFNNERECDLFLEQLNSLHPSLHADDLRKRVWPILPFSRWMLWLKHRQNSSPLSTENPL